MAHRLVLLLHKAHQAVAGHWASVWPPAAAATTGSIWSGFLKAPDIVSVKSTFPGCASHKTAKATEEASIAPSFKLCLGRPHLSLPPCSLGKLALVH